VAVLCGLLGAYVVRQSLKPVPVVEQDPDRPERVAVPMASMDLPAGRQVVLGDITVVRMTREEVKKRGVRQPFMNNTQHIIGRVLRTDLERGATFDTTMFYPDGTGPRIDERLDDGLRAVTVPVQGDDALLGFAGAGTWVDVLFRSHSSPKEDYPEMTVTLLERVQVLAVNREIFEGARPRTDTSRLDRPIAVTLAVSPEQAAAQRVVDGRGTLALALRRPGDEQTSATRPPRTLDEVLQRPRLSRYMEVYRGRTFSRLRFRTSGSTPADADKVGRVEEVPDPTAGGQTAARPATPADAVNE
jgi:Flp pilus assembly protein CpaB